jgi:ferredoxin
MAIKITDDCICCSACIPECPNNAIYGAGEEWRISDGTTVKGNFELLNGEIIDANQLMKAISDDFVFIVSDKCTECQGFHDEPQCAVACPVDCCIPNELIVESKEGLLAKKNRLHI